MYPENEQWLQKPEEHIPNAINLPPGAFSEMFISQTDYTLDETKIDYSEPPKSYTHYTNAYSSLQLEPLIKEHVYFALPMQKLGDFIHTDNKYHIEPDIHPGKTALSNILSKSQLNGEHWRENRLTEMFIPLLQQINFADVVVPMRKSKPVIDQDQFSFVPILRSSARPSSRPLYNVAVPPDIRTTYRGDGKPYLDTPRAIGLVYGDWLVAVGGAQVQTDGKLLIKQLQDVTNVRRDTDPEKFAQTGLRNGFWWRDTLVNAWESITAKLAGTEVIIQSNDNSAWFAVQQAQGRGYDDVAKRRHYTREPVTGNWVKTLDITT